MSGTTWRPGRPQGPDVSGRVCHWDSLPGPHRSVAAIVPVEAEQTWLEGATPSVAVAQRTPGRRRRRVWPRRSLDLTAVERSDSLRRNRDFMAMWTGQVGSMLGSQATRLAFPLLVLSLSGSAAQAGVVAFSNTLPMVLLSLPAGVWIDRHDRRAAMLTVDLVGALAAGSLVAAIALGAVRLAHVMVAAFLLGAVTVIFGLAEESALPQVVASEQLPEAIAQNESRTYAAQLAGPAVGGLLFGAARLAPFLFDAVSYVVGAMSLWFVKTPLQEPREPDGGPFSSELVEGVRWLWGQSCVRTCALLGALVNFVWAGLLLVLVLEAKRQGASSATVGSMLAVLAIGGLLGSFVAPALRRGLSVRTTVAGALWLQAACIPVLAFRPSPVLLGVIAALAMMMLPAWNAVVVAMRLALTPDRLRGRMTSAARCIVGAMIPLGSLGAGFAAQSLGTQTTFLALAAVALLIALAGTSAASLRDISHDAPSGARVRNATLARGTSHPAVDPAGPS